MGIDFAEEVYDPEETSVCLITAFKVEFKAGDIRWSRVCDA